MPLLTTTRLPSSFPANLIPKDSEKGSGGFSANVKSVRSVPDGIIYSPFYNEDMVIQALEINTARVLKGKEPLPMICSMLNRGTLKSSISEFKDKELQVRLKYGESYEKKMSPYIKLIGVTSVHDAFPLETKRLGEYQAINQLRVTDPKTLPDKTIETIYVIGHGEAGRPHLYETAKCGSGSKPISDVISEISRLVIKKVKSDVKIKITACESADRETLHSFDKINDFSERERGTEPLAKSAKKEASKHFPESRVFGYHGLGISRGADYISKARCLYSNFDNTTGKVSQWVKASTVRKEF
ncbi:hypothetical protein [Vibrio sp. CUB2]|uniref:hypothetical protein n=1 Tax=Vibrio sp. CUB2 TaxID=2315233 RepID=UPI00076A29C4|nr:hypothetical protein [Vibrio sp. CUB2]